MRNQMYKKQEQSYDNRKAPKWRTEQKQEEKNEMKERFDSAPAVRFEKSNSEPVAEPVIDNSIPILNGDIPFEETKPSDDTYFSDIIVEPPVKEVIRETICQEKKRKKDLMILRA
jgi:hypothetical protein